LAQKVVSIFKKPAKLAVPDATVAAEAEAVVSPEPDGGGGGDGDDGAGGAGGAAATKDEPTASPPPAVVVTVSQPHIHSILPFLTA
jgi:hypothetical protein